ncbi:murein L,D-transpeptidase [Blastochloris viridis]|uniref:Murein L,D-transpeptidase n=1 Tax=Blastochloris viridis TaxID=1079 RepID=A0A0S4PYJ4_BLAVI|nr:murein L,D-transpeptidase [Blastochloris viridis]
MASSPLAVLSRRSLLAGLGAGVVAGPAAAQDFFDGLMRAEPRPAAHRAAPGAEWSQGFDSASRNIQMPRSSLPTLSPETREATEQAVQIYANIVARGGWPMVPPADRLRLGMRHRSVPALRQRLAVSGDLDSTAGVSDVFDSFVEAGVRRFQARNGIQADGVVRESTFRALNVPAELRARQLEINAARLRARAGALGNRYVAVNIPAAQLEAVENNVVVSRHTAIVGKPDRPSPELAVRILEVNFNPFWTVPVSIIRKDLIPKMQAEPDYLAKYKIRVYDGRGRELDPRNINWNSDEAVNYQFRQDPGEQNSMGTVRINMANPHSVYMHDTPQKNLFGEDRRFDSSGCVRVQNVRDLVTWILAGTQWDRSHVDAVSRSGERIDARPVQPIPVYWVYVSAWATADGVVQFREDIYDRDGLGGLVAGR